MFDFYENACAVVERPLATREPGGFWRMDDPVLNEKGELVKGGMWEPQRQWWNLRNFTKLFVAGFGAGKTLIGAKRTIGLALQNNHTPVAYVAPTYNLARHTGIATIASLLHGKRTLLGRGFWWRFNKSTHEFFIRYRGRTGHIIVYSAEDPDSLRGPNLAAVWMDEPFIMVEEAFNHMMARIRHPDAKVKELLLTGTPEQLNWGYELCLGEKKLKNDVGLIQASTRSNLVTGADYVKRLEGVFADKAADAYIEGKFVNLGSGLVYYGFGGIGSSNIATYGYTDKQDQRTKLPIPYIPDGVELGVGMDFNVDPMAAVVFCRYGNHIHFFHEIELENADTEYLCDYLIDHYARPGHPDSRIREGQELRYVYPDTSGSKRSSKAPGGKTDYYYIKQAGFEIRAKTNNPHIRDREQAVNGKLRPKLHPDSPTMTIDPNCRRLIKYLQTYSHEKRATDEQKAMSHLIDAMGYPVAYLYPVNRETVKLKRLGGW